MEASFSIINSGFQISIMGEAISHRRAMPIYSFEMPLKDR
jgi:hypothetical protein